MNPIRPIAHGSIALRLVGRRDYWRLQHLLTQDRDWLEPWEATTPGLRTVVNARWMISSLRIQARRGTGYGFVILKEVGESRNQENLAKEINQLISDQIGPIAKLDKIQFVSGLPKTRSGKIMRRILRKIAEGDFSNFGDISTLLNPEIVEEIKNEKL